MKFLAISTNTADPRAFLAAESTRMSELMNSGLVERMMLKADWSGSVLLLQADDLGQARAAVDSLPLVVQGVTTFALTEVVEPPHTAPTMRQVVTP